MAKTVITLAFISLVGFALFNFLRKTETAQVYPSPEPSMKELLSVSTINSSSLIRDWMQLPGDFNNKDWEEIECAAFQSTTFDSEQLLALNYPGMDRVIEEIDKADFYSEVDKTTYDDEVRFDAFCKQEGNYYLIFRPYNDGVFTKNRGWFDVYAAGGGALEADLAVYEDGQLRIKRSIGGAPLSAYWGCGEIFGLKEGKLFLGCSGGDGGGGANSIREVDLKTLEIRDLIACQYMLGNAKCATGGGRVYYEDGYDEVVESFN